MVEGTTIAAVNAILTTTTSLCPVAKVVSANCMYSAVNVYMIVNQWDATFFFFFDIKALEYDKLVITTSLVGNRKFPIAREGSINTT